MQVSNLFNEDESTGNRAVSPVIGVILMVAITVILAAVIGTFVLGLGDQVSESAPQASINFNEASDEFEINHRGGDTLQTENVEIRLDGVDISSDVDIGSDEWETEAETFSAGQTATVTDLTVFDEDARENVDIVFTNGDRESIIASFTTSEDFGDS